MIHVKTPGGARGIVMNAQRKNMTDDQFDKVVDINLMGVYNCTRAIVGADGGITL